MKSSTNNKKSSQWRSWLGVRAAFIAWASALGACIAISAPYHSLSGAAHESLPWLLGLLGHWQWAFLVSGLLAAVLALAVGRYLAFLPAAVILASWFHHLPQAPFGGEKPGAAQLRVVTANLNYANSDISALVQWVQGGDAPDVLVLQEFTEEHQAQLQRSAGAHLFERFPHRVLHPQPDQFGLALLSKHPIEEHSVILGADHLSTPKIRARLRWNDGLIAVSVVHPMPPISATYAQVGHASLSDEADHLVATGLPGLLVGDLNDTPWGAGLRALEGRLFLASGLAPTWPNAAGLASLLPLDHILVTSHWRRSGTLRGPDTGSDHRAAGALLTPVDVVTR